MNQLFTRKYTWLLLMVVVLMSCKTQVKLAIPETFQEQATKAHVGGARTKKMTLDHFTISKIKRGMHLGYPGWGRGFFLENLLLGTVGIQKSESIQKEKDRFRFSISDGKSQVQIFAKENELTRHISYKSGNGNGFFQKFEQLQEYRYVFSANISTDTSIAARSWELCMSNIYDRKTDANRNIFAVIKPDDSGLATNGTDTIFIKALTLKKTESPKGKVTNLPFKLLAGYELSTTGGVIAIIDVIDRNIWYYNELEPDTKLIVSGISTAIFARRVNDVKW